MAIGTAAIATIVPLFLYDGGLFTNVWRIMRNVRANEKLYAVDSLAYNNSLKGTLLALSNRGPTILQELSQFLLDHFTIVALVLACIGISMMFVKEMDSFGTALLGAILMTTTVDYVGSYAVGIYFVVFVCLMDDCTTFGRTRSWFICGLLAVQMMPKGYPLRFWSVGPAGNIATFTSLLGGISSMLLLIVVAREYLTRRGTQVKTTILNIDV